MATKEISLPEEMIHLIQSYMIEKEAARTSILSKSWYHSWLTRPDLHFDHRDFGELGNAQDVFWRFVRKTTQRYRESNLPIKSFRLCISYGNVNFSRAEKYIVRAIELGATDIDFEVNGGRRRMVLPKEVLGSETLRRLSVSGCNIGLGDDRKAKCPKLESLSLKNVVYTDGEIIWNIISSCPLIENLSLSDCKIVDAADTTKVINKPWRLREKLTGSSVDGIINPFNKLKSLFLEKLPIHISFFRDIESRFPCLKDLTIRNCDGRYGFRIPWSSNERISFDYHTKIKIASSSLESISFVQNTRLKAEFDVPCVRKFMYEGTALPSLSFMNYSSGGKLDITVSFNRHCYCPPWFRRLKKLLAKLSHYEICLSLEILDSPDVNRGDYYRDLCAVAVKDLILYLKVPSSITYAFFRGLFWSCHPEFITLHLFPGEERRNHDFFVLLSMTVVFGMRAVNFEVFDEGPAEWRGTPLETLLQASQSPEYRGKVRFQLRAIKAMSCLSPSPGKNKGKIRFQLI